MLPLEKNIVHRLAVRRELQKLRTYWDDTLGKCARRPRMRPSTRWSVSGTSTSAARHSLVALRLVLRIRIGRGTGFRHSTGYPGFAHQIPAVGKRLLDIASTQFPEGRAHHQYSPLTKKGSGEDRRLTTSG